MRRFAGALWALLASCAWAQAPKPPVVHAEGQQPFIVFDGLLNPDKPDLRKLGMPELRGTANIWRSGISHDVLDARGVESVVKFMKTFGDSFYLDVENWPVYNAPPEVVEASIAKLIRVAEITRATAPNHRFGFYGLLPQHVHWAFILKKQDEIAAWQRSNELAAPLASHVDFVLPSLYTFYDDPEGWRISAREILVAARRYGRPVYPFLWPEYQDSNEQLAGKPVPRDYWRMELEFVRQYADGVVLWGGYQKKWNENAPWWLETKDFLKTLQ
jgi:hypothetical protein